GRRPDRYVGDAAGPLSNLLCTAVRERGCTRAGQQRLAVLGALALGLSGVSAANVPGMGRAFVSFLRLGRSLLRPATLQRQTGKHRRASSCVQVDSHSVSLLEGPHTVL